MPELILFQSDRDRLAELLGGRKRPHGVKKGVWTRLVRNRDLDILDISDLRSLAVAEPEVLRILGIPERLA